MNDTLSTTLTAPNCMFTPGGKKYDLTRLLQTKWAIHSCPSSEQVPINKGTYYRYDENGKDEYVEKKD